MKILAVALLALSPTVLVDGVEESISTSEKVETSESVSESISESVSETTSTEGEGKLPTDLEEAKDTIGEWLAKWFEPATVATILSWVTYLGTIVTLVWKLKQLKQTNNLTLDNVIKAVTEELKKVLPEEVSGQIEKYMPELRDSAQKQTEVMKAFCKILSLAQVNDATSRLAILDLIEQIGMIEKSEIDKARKAIEESEAKKEEKKEETEAKVEEIIGDTYDGTSI